jgi:hypothetical protein
MPRHPPRRHGSTEKRAEFTAEHAERERDVDPINPDPHSASSAISAVNIFSSQRLRVSVVNAFPGFKTAR